MYPWLQIGPVYLSTYSLCFLAAFITGGNMVYREAIRRGRATDEMLYVALGALAGGVIGCKVSMFIFLGPQTWVRDLPYLWYSGQAWTGGFFGGYVGVLIVKRWRHITYATGDVFALALPVAQAIGRLGNLLGGDPFGLPTTLPWGIIQQGVRRQPSAAYELILDLALFALLYILRDRMWRSGDLFNLYVLGYCALRFLVDFTRADPHVLWGLTLVQCIDAIAVIQFGVMLLRSYLKHRALAATTPGPVPALGADPAASA
ncbi:MAG TPA: prolipoprotein diacylglyceryl transferase family protein [Ktedonobacterales bacterium]